MKKNNNKGFTLVELIIVAAIIGILAGVGYPMYTSMVEKGNRGDAIDDILRLAQDLEEYYLANDTYVGATVANPTSSDGLYTLSISSQTAYAWTIKATPTGTDAKCGDLIYNSLGQKTASTGATDCW